jgi:hypothetical protein
MSCLSSIFGGDGGTSVSQHAKELIEACADRLRHPRHTGGPLLSQRSTDSLDRGHQVPHHQLRRDPDNPIPERLQLRVSSRICLPLARMAPPIHLDHQPHRRSAEVDHVPPGQRHLPPKLHPELAPAQRRPQPSFRLGERPAIRPRALLEPKLLLHLVLFFPITH